MGLNTEQIVFGHNFEGLFMKGLGEQVTPGLRAQLREAGIDLEKPLLPGYPVQTWMKALSLTAAALYGHRPVDEAYEELGRRFIGGYFETMLGKALLAMLKVVGPERTFKRMTQNFRSGNNFNEVESRILAPGKAEMRINHVLCEGPGFVRGILQQGLTMIAGHEVSVDVERFEGTSAVYLARWKP